MRGTECLSADKALLVETGFARGARLELSLACSAIPRMDVMSKSDPFCVFYLRAGKDCWERVGKTETIVDVSSCRWVKKFYIEKTFVASEMRLEVYDRDTERDILKDHDFIGFVEGRFIFNMLEDDQHHTKLALAREGQKKGSGFLSMTLDWVEKPIVNYDVTITVQVEYSVRSKMYYQLMKKTQGDVHYVPVFRSQLLDKDDAEFEPCTVRLSQLSGGSSSRTFRIELFQFFPMGRSKVLGFVRTSVDSLDKFTEKGKIPWNSCNNGLDKPTVLVTKKSTPVRSGKAFLISIIE